MERWVVILVHGCRQYCLAGGQPVPFYSKGFGCSEAGGTDANSRWWMRSTLFGIYSVSSLRGYLTYLLCFTLSLSLSVKLVIFGWIFIFTFSFQDYWLGSWYDVISFTNDWLSNLKCPCSFADKYIDAFEFLLMTFVSTQNHLQLVNFLIYAYGLVTTSV